MKKITTIIFICWSVAILCCACRKDVSEQEEVRIEEDPVEEKQVEEKQMEEEQKNDTTDLSEEDQEPVIQQNSKDLQVDDLNIEEWKAAYLSHLDGLAYADSYTYSLIYVDEDEIPELLIDTGGEAGGCCIVTFHDGILDEWQSNRLNVTYIEKGNLICNSDGNMGFYYDSVYTIQDGKWCYVEGGNHGDGPNGVQLDENGNYMGEVYVWHGKDVKEEWEEFWSGEEISREEYEAQLNRVYPTLQEKRPERYYILKEICSILRTGDVSSAGHRYELVVEDLTWTEAEAMCCEKGGYLAAITSWEELKRIEEQIISENKTDITFFVGVQNPREKPGRWGYYWIEPESGTYYDILELYDALYGLWLDGEPSYMGMTWDGIEVNEDYGAIFYLKEDERCYLNDVPDDILSAAPFYSGRVGYICEYDN